jgi:hypothetical protein
MAERDGVRHAGPMLRTTDAEIVRVLLDAAGLPADASEVDQLAHAYPILRGQADALYVVLDEEAGRADD